MRKKIKELMLLELLLVQPAIRTGCCSTRAWPSLNSTMGNKITREENKQKMMLYLGKKRSAKFHCFPELQFKISIFTAIHPLPLTVTAILSSNLVENLANLFWGKCSFYGSEGFFFFSLYRSVFCILDSFGQLT